MNPSADILQTMTEAEVDTSSKPSESLQHIAAYDVEKLLSTSSGLSESLLLQLRQSLTKNGDPVLWVFFLKILFKNCLQR